MRSGTNTKNSDQTPVPAPSGKPKNGPSVRLPIKRTYCNKCHKLVNGQMQLSGNTKRIICPKCNQNLWIWNSLIWRSAKNGTTTSP
jgi:RNase P subunit RPR2